MLRAPSCDDVEVARFDDELYRNEGRAALSRVVSACPSFEPDDEETGLAWVEAGSLGRYLLMLLDNGRLAEVRAALAAMEQIFVDDGPPGAINVIVTGLMESVPPTRDDFAELLGQKSRRWWRGLNAYMSGLQPRLEPLDE